jgi:hypothetical protein
MRRRILIVLFATGTLAGYASGFASFACHAHGRRDGFERHIARICVDAARGVDTPQR